MNDADIPQANHRWLWRTLRIPLALVLAFYLFSHLFNPLPGDEKMIAHFQAHREEFAALVQKFKAFTPTKENPIFEVAENKALMKKAAIGRVTEVGYGGFWYPNPYSPESVRHYETLAKEAGTNVLNFIHPYRAINFSMEEQPLGRSYRMTVLFSAGVIWVMKSFVYFPEPPKIENGRLWYPVNTSGELWLSRRAFSSLDWYPLEWERGECLYRQIEPHWFINMCTSY